MIVSISYYIVSKFGDNKTTMENNNLEKSVQDLIDSINKNEYSKFENFFIESYHDQWSKIPKEEKSYAVNKIIELKNNPSQKNKFNELVEQINNYHNKKSEIMILFLGVLLGISGNLVANLLDRHLSHFGCFYNFFVIAIFIIPSWFVYDIFIKKTGKEITDNQDFIEIIKILDKIENYK